MDTHFHEALDESEKWIGPFADYEMAKRELARRVGAAIVDSKIQYRIERISWAMSLSLLKFAGQASLVDEVMLPS